MDHYYSNCLFVGNFFEEKSLAKYLHYSQLSMGNDTYEKNFISILENISESLSCISFVPIPKFSHKFPFLFIKGKHLSKRKTTFDFLPFINSRIFNFRNYILNKSIKKKIKTNNPKFVFLSTYHMMPQIKYIKKKFPNIKTILLLPDLPMIEISKLSPFAKIYMSKINKLFKKNINNVDLLLPITNQEISFIPFYKNKSMVYESYFDCASFDHFANIDKKKTILYAGSLNKNYGIMDLVSAFISANIHDYKLIICGNGNSQSSIIEYSKENDNIIYLGQIEHRQVLRLEKESRIIVCPDSEKRECSFHSKYLEYLCSGTPIISFYPHGAKKEYIEFLYLVEENGGTLESAIKKAINADLENMEQVASKAKHFMKTKKNLSSFAEELTKNLNEL